MNAGMSTNPALACALTARDRRRARKDGAGPTSTAATTQPNLDFESCVKPVPQVHMPAPEVKVAPGLGQLGEVTLLYRHAKNVGPVALDMVVELHRLSE